MFGRETDPRAAIASATVLLQDAANGVARAYCPSEGRVCQRTVRAVIDGRGKVILKLMKSAKARFRKGFGVVFGNKRSQAATMVIPVGGKEGGPDNNHRTADQWLFIISGKGTATIAGKRISLRERSLVLIERGENHEIRNTGKTDLVTLNFYVPPAYTNAGNELPAAKPK